MKLYINESRFQNLVNEVRYIDNGIRFDSRQNRHDIVQTPLRNDEVIRVFHGFSTIDDAILIAKYGTSGKGKHARRFSYENGMNPHGLFVTTSPVVFQDFAEGYNIFVGIEFSAKISDLDFPVWNGQNTYFGQGSNPQPFGNKEERDMQRNSYQQDALNPTYNKKAIVQSDNPALAHSIFNNNEHQALFVGDLDPNMIKRFWVKDITKGKRWVKFTRTEFLRVYGKKEIEKYIDEEHKNPKERLYRPNEDFDSIEGAAQRYLKKYGRDVSLEEVCDYINRGFEEGVGYIISSYFWPKQIIQYKGLDYFRKYCSPYYDNPEYTQFKDGVRPEEIGKDIEIIEFAQKYLKNGWSIRFNSNGDVEQGVNKEWAEKHLAELERKSQFNRSVFNIHNSYDITLEDAKQIYMENNSTENKEFAVELYMYIADGSTFTDFVMDTNNEWKELKEKLSSRFENKLNGIEINGNKITVNMSKLRIKKQYGEDYVMDSQDYSDSFNIKSVKAKKLVKLLMKDERFALEYRYNN